MVGSLVGESSSGDFELTTLEHDDSLEFFPSRICDCYSLGSIHVVYPCSGAGGLIGFHCGGEVNRSYTSTGISAVNNGAGMLVSGFIAKNESFWEEDLDPYGQSDYDVIYTEYPPTVSGCFWDSEATGLSESAAGEGATTAQMQLAKTFTDAGWDFETVWKMPEGDPFGYPVLQALPAPDLSSLHDADTRPDYQISLSELLRFIQFFNTGAYHAAGAEASEDGFNPGEGDTSAAPHSGDYAAPYWNISLSELLRLIQIYNSAYYYPCAGAPEDGCCLPSK